MQFDYAPFRSLIVAAVSSAAQANEEKASIPDQLRANSDVTVHCCIICAIIEPEARWLSGVNRLDF